MRDGIDETRVVILREPEADALQRQLARGPVVVLSGTPNVAADLARRTDQAWGLVPPDVGPDHLAAVVRAVAAGFTVLPPALTTSVLVANGTPVSRSRLADWPLNRSLRASARCCSGWPMACPTAPSPRLWASATTR